MPRRRPKKIKSSKALKAVKSSPDSLEDFLIASDTITQTFPLFPRLPAELRQRIFSFALPSSRQLYLHRSHRPKDDTCRPPALLSVNQEARHVAQQHYRLLLLPVKGSVMGQKWADYCHEHFMDLPYNDYLPYYPWGQLRRPSSMSIEEYRSWQERCKRAIYVSPKGLDSIARKDDGSSWTQAILVKGSEAWDRVGAEVDWGLETLTFVAPAVSESSSSTVN